MPTQWLVHAQKLHNQKCKQIAENVDISSLAFKSYFLVTFDELTVFNYLLNMKKL